GAAQRPVQLLGMRACSGRGHATTRGAVEGVLEAKDLDPELAGFVAVENPMRGVGLVVASDAGVVSPDAEMGAAVVAPDDGVEERLFWSRVAHPRGIRRQQGAVGGEVAGPQLLVA